MIMTIHALIVNVLLLSVVSCVMVLVSWGKYDMLVTIPCWQCKSFIDLEGFTKPWKWIQREFVRLWKWIREDLWDSQGIAGDLEDLRN